MQRCMFGSDRRRVFRRQRRGRGRIVGGGGVVVRRLEEMVSWRLVCLAQDGGVY